MAGRRIIPGLMSAALLMVAGLASPPLQAEMIYRFEPSLEILLMHDGDVFSSSFDEELSDQLAVLRPVLSLVGQSQRTILNLTYAPEAQFFNEYNDLDRVNHRAEFDFNRTINPRSNWEFGGVYLNTADTYSDLLQEEIVTTRTDRQLWAANTDYSVGVSERVDLSFRYGFRDLEYEDPDIIGHTSHVAGTAVGLITGPRSSVALDYAYQYFSYPERGDYGVHNLLAHYTFRPTQRTSLSLDGGAFFQDYRPEEGGEEPEDINDTGFLGGIEWGIEGRRFSFDAALTRRVRASGGIGQSVLSHGLRLGVSGTLSRTVTMSFSGLAQRNEPTVSTEEGDVDLMRASLNCDWNVLRWMGLRFFADYIYQSWESGTRRDLSYPRGGVSVIFSLPRSRS